MGIDRISVHEMIEMGLSKNGDASWPLRCGEIPWDVMKIWCNLGGYKEQQDRSMKERTNNKSSHILVYVLYIIIYVHEKEIIAEDSTM